MKIQTKAIGIAAITILILSLPGFFVFMMARNHSPSARSSSDGVIYYTSSTIMTIGLPDNARWSALVGFNLGVETGQLAIAAAVWFIQRAFDATLFYGIFGA